MYPLFRMPKEQHRYKQGATFDQVMMLYRFDKKLRMPIFNEIEKIEMAVRSATHSRLAAHGHPKAREKGLELLRTCDHDPHHAHVLCQLLHFPRRARKGLNQADGRARKSAPRLSLFDHGAYFFHGNHEPPIYWRFIRLFDAFSLLADTNIKLYLFHFN